MICVARTYSSDTVNFLSMDPSFWTLEIMPTEQTPVCARSKKRWIKRDQNEAKVKWRAESAPLLEMVDTDALVYFFLPWLALYIQRTFSEAKSVAFFYLLRLFYMRSVCDWRAFVLFHVQSANVYRNGCGGGCVLVLHAVPENRQKNGT